ncbi:MAG: 2-oxo acid dehydrogenase subunit E2 [Fimbriimonadaceae bacterium]|nr:2-oxo acid dehydrogenase subunit E2 [Fimbriimonadaceae bacterium]
MPIISVRIPQMGEGLQEARLVAVLKQPGEQIKRDEPIYQMETDKAVMDVESPYEGTLIGWTAEVDSILPIGAPVAKMEVAEGTREMEVHGGPADEAVAATADSAAATAEPATAAGARNAMIPPRTRAYAKEKGISDDVLGTISSRSGKLMPSDIDAFLEGGDDSGAVTPVASGVGGKFVEEAVAPAQRLLASRLVRGTQLVVPGTISVAAVWESIERVRAIYKSSGDEFQPSAFTMFAYAVAQATKKFPSFRSTLIGNDVLRTYQHVNIGIAVALPGDELVLAVVQEADKMDFRTFGEECRRVIKLAREGQDQANESVTISLTNMQHYGLRDAVPVVVPPSVGTLFLGEVYNGLDNDSVDTISMKRTVNLALTFDHRVINGVGAAEYLQAIKTNVETALSVVPGP